MIKQHPITSTMQKIAPDVECIWNAVIERWQVYQLVKRGIIANVDGQQRKDRRLMWTIQTADGSYRYPGPNDIKFLQDTVDRSHKLWSGDVDQIAGGMERDELEREKQVSEKPGEMIHALVREIGHLTKSAPVRDKRAYVEAAATDILGIAR
jgi:hypothetical protein